MIPDFPDVPIVFWPDIQKFSFDNLLNNDWKVDMWERGNGKN